MHIDDLNPNNNTSFFSGTKAQAGGQDFSQTDMGFVKLQGWRKHEVSGLFRVSFETEQIHRALK